MKLDKACTETAELQAEKLVLIERIFHLHEKCCAFFSRELCLCKQLGFLGEKKKKLFARELVSIEDLKRSEQEASEGVGSSDAVEGSELMANPFDGLFDLFSSSILAFFADIPQSSEPPLS